MKKIWLWLEDQQESVADFKSDLKKSDIQFQSFAQIERLIEFLIKEKDKKTLGQYGIISDILLYGVNSIICPKEWTGQAETKFFDVGKAYDAGILFCEKFILNINNGDNTPFWNPPPPIIFLTVLHTDYAQTQSRLEKMKRKWGEVHKVDYSDSGIKWIEKWNAMDNKIVNLIRELEK